MKYLSNGANTAVNFNTETLLLIDDAANFFAVGSALGMIEHDVVELCISLQIVLTSDATRTFTLTPLNKDVFAVNAEYEPITFTFTGPIEGGDNGVVNINHKFVFSDISQTQVGFYLHDTVNEVITVNSVLSSFGDLPRTGGVDVRTVVGAAPMTEDDIAGVILEDTDVLLKNNPGGFMQG